MVSLLSEKKLFYFSIIVMILTRYIIYFDANFIGDISNSYVKSTTDFTQFLLEPGYIYLIKLISVYTSTPSVIMYIVQHVVMITILITGLIISNQRNHRLIIVAIVMASGFTFLATQNALRQGIAAPLIILSYYYIINKKPLIATSLFVTAQAFHFSSFIFVAVLIFNKASLRIFRSKFDINSLGFGIFLFVGITSTVGLISYILFDYLYIAGRNNERFSGYAKPIIIFLYFIVTTFLFFKLEKNNRYENDNLSLLNQRLIFYSIFFGLSANTLLVEVASRVLFFCYAIDLFYLLRFEIKRKYTTQLKIWIFINIVWALNPSIYGLLIQKA